MGFGKIKLVTFFLFIYNNNYKYKTINFSHHDCHVFEVSFQSKEIEMHKF